MPGVARIGDAISHGGSISTGSVDVFDVSEGSPKGIARVGDAAVCDIHGAVTISTGSTKVFADGLGVARIGDTLSCGAVIMTGSLVVNAV